MIDFLSAQSTVTPSYTVQSQTQMEEGNFDLKFLPSSLRERLLPFQQKGVAYAIKKHGRCLIGDEMGLGKTIQAIAVAYYYRSEWPLLVVLPSSMKYPWIEELEKWLPCLQPKDINLITTSTDVSNIPKAAISLVGYGLMQSSYKTLLEALDKQSFKVIIVDESHFLKNLKAARTKTLVPLLTKAKRVIMLSGTPALARPAELYSQVNCLRQGQFGSWSSFAKRYCGARWKFFGRVRKWDTSGASNLPELHKKLTSSVMIRREKREVLTELPPKRRQKVPFELSESKQKKDLDALWSELGLYLKGEFPPSSSGKDAGFEIRRLAMDLYISTGKAKIAAISEYVRMLLDNQEMKFLVFAHHKEILTAVVQTVQAYAREKEPSLKYIRIDGDVPPIERMKEVNRFQQDPHVRVAALSIMAAGTGLTLTAASHVVFAELHWTPGVLEQCEDRAHRIGQQNAIHVHYLVARGTIDEWMWSALNKKVGVLSSTLNGRLQKLDVEVLGGGVSEFLKQAVFWMPSTLDQEEDDSFFFSQKTKHPESRDIRSYMQASQRKNGGAPPEKEPITKESSPVISLLEESDDESEGRTTGEATGIPAGGNVGQDVAMPGDLPTTSSKEPSFQHSTSLIPSISSSKSPDSVSKSSDDRDSCGYDGRVAEVKQNLPCSDEASTSSKTLEDPYQGGSSDPEYELVTGVKFSSLHKVSCVSSRKSLPGNASQSCHNTALDLGEDIQEKPFVAMNERSEASGTKTDADRNLGDDLDQQTAQSQWSCQACTFLNHDSLPHCELCDTPRKRRGKRQRVNTRSRVRKKLKNRGTPNVKVETLSDSDEDFETSVSTCHKRAQSNSVSKSRGHRSKDEIIAEDNVPKKTSSGQDSPSVGLKYEKPEKHQTPTAGHSRSPAPSHGIEISDSDGDSEDGAFKVEPLAMDQSTPDGKRTKEGQKCRHSICDSYSPSGSKVQEAEGVVKPKAQRAEVQSKGSPLRRARGDISSSSESKKNGLVVDLSEDLFPDEEYGTSDETKVDRNGKRVSQPSIDREPEGAVRPSLLSSPSYSKSKVRSWTCIEPSCRHLNSPSDVECENCWASKPDQETRVGGSTLRNGSESDRGLSSGFVSASEVLISGSQSQMKSTRSKVGFVHREAASGGEDERICHQNDGKQGEDRMKSEAESVKRDATCEEESAGTESFEVFLYCASKFTDRIYLYNAHQQPLNCSFQPLDLRMRDLENLPPVLHSPQHTKIARRFLKEWESLTELKKRKLRKSGLIFDSPTAAVDALMKKQPFQLSTRRFLTKDDLANAALQKAEDIGGSLRVIHKKLKPSLPFKSPPKSDGHQSVTSPAAGKKRKKILPEEETEGRDKEQEPKKKLKQGAESSEVISKYGFVQAMGVDGVPLCVFCSSPVEAAGFSNDNAAWDTRYCSEICKQENKVRWKNSKYVREQLLEAEHGVCQICALDAHGMYKNIRDLPKSKRKDFLSRTAYSDLPVKQLNEMIRSPMEGQFWHADHIVPVYKGGGLCSLENFRTLCVICHAKVTAEQSHERKEARTEGANRKAGLRDIRKFLKDKG